MKYYFLGASNPETIRMLRSVERQVPSFIVGGFLDNDKNKKGKDFYGYPILGGCEFIKGLDNENSRIVNLITANTNIRYETTQDILKYGGKLGNLIHPSIDLAMVSIGLGNYFQEGVILQAGVNIGDNCSIHIGALIGHETTISNDTFIAHGVSVSGCCNIGQGCFIGTNASILPRVKIGNWVTIGAGSVVRKDVPDGAVIVGNPGQIMIK
jgi:sugar O-acyltransferase (sialic acid O-acetyltransferase NeuD family)